jgi:hypothetical protein
MSVNSLTSPSFRVVFETFTNQIVDEACFVANDISCQDRHQTERCKVCVNRGVELLGNITPLIRLGLNDFNVQEKWFQTCLKTLSFARCGLEECLQYESGTKTLHILEDCIALFLEYDDEDYEVFEELPQKQKDDVYSSMSSQLFGEPKELTLGQDHFYMSGVSTVTKIQAIVAAWKKAFTSMTSF